MGISQYKQRVSVCAQLTCNYTGQQYLPVLYNHLSACVFSLWCYNISLSIEVAVGLVHRVSEDVGIVELCVCVIIPNIPCPVTHSFEVSLSTANISAGIKNDYGVHSKPIIEGLGPEWCNPSKKSMSYSMHSGSKSFSCHEPKWTVNFVLFHSYS